MAEKRQAFPLAWPPGWERTKRPGRSQFKTSLSKAMDNVDDSLRRFAADSDKKVENLLISSNFTLTDRRPKDAGVAVYFTWDGLETCIAVDRYAKLEDNLQAIHHCIEAERTKLRHGGLNLVRAAFRGYAALPPPTAPGDPWHRVLGVSPDAGPQEVEAAYKKLRSKLHPDHGGDAREFHRVRNAWDHYKRAVA